MTSAPWPLVSRLTSSLQFAALDQVSLDVGECEIVALVGANGHVFGATLMPQALWVLG
jgi:ABC-type branched-subunit amino acid transport system ATPase component